jgi:serine/threonine protein kinase
VTLHPGSIIGPYEILSALGVGGMGEVWKARDTRLNRIVAIKTLKGTHSAFEREARAIAALNHPHVCTLYDVGPDYLVMEHARERPSPNGSKKARCRSNKRSSTECRSPMPRQSAPAGNHPSRSEAIEHHADQGWGEAS